MTNHSFLLIVMLFCMFLVSKTVRTIEADEEVYAREDLYSVVLSSSRTKRPPDTDESENRDRDVTGPSLPGADITARRPNPKFTVLPMEPSTEKDVKKWEFSREFKLQNPQLRGYTHENGLRLRFIRAPRQPPTSVEIFNKSKSPFLYSLFHPEAGKDAIHRSLNPGKGHTIPLTHAHGLLKWDPASRSESPLVASCHTGHCSKSGQLYVYNLHPPHSPHDAKWLGVSYQQYEESSFESGPSTPWGRFLGNLCFEAPVGQWEPEGTSTARKAGLDGRIQVLNRFLIHSVARRPSLNRMAASDVNSDATIQASIAGSAERPMGAH
ncbi:hypothetical protein PCASD_05154 [Puccinia coronata f. sp. avenae]|uniref:Uncharacterized protein n=1 Tax=Puccinia coronata f. sp. avenae TaxID=200324 RepID=A0A2N5V3L9_9BASI|nr:hypothetical protein PCASD_05154 [Puccinia coronata f. sp. avenae]